MNKITISETFVFKHSSNDTIDWTLANVANKEFPEELEKDWGNCDRQRTFPPEAQNSIRSSNPHPFNRILPTRP
jgi:hypothetical protein